MSLLKSAVLQLSWKARTRGWISISNFLNGTGPSGEPVSVLPVPEWQEERKAKAINSRQQVLSRETFTIVIVCACQAGIWILELIWIKAQGRWRFCLRHQYFPTGKRNLPNGLSLHQPVNRLSLCQVRNNGQHAGGRFLSIKKQLQAIVAPGNDEFIGTIGIKYIFTGLTEILPFG